MAAMEEMGDTDELENPEPVGVMLIRFLGFILERVARAFPDKMASLVKMVKMVGEEAMAARFNYSLSKRPQTLLFLWTFKADEAVEPVGEGSAVWAERVDSVEMETLVAILDRWECLEPRDDRAGLVFRVNQGL